MKKTMKEKPTLLKSDLYNSVILLHGVRDAGDPNGGLNVDYTYTRSADENFKEITESAIIKDIEDTIYELILKLLDKKLKD